MSPERDAYERGMQVRREVLGDAHVDARGRAHDRLHGRLPGATSRATIWGGIWGRPGLDRRMRSAVTLTALVALGREGELAMHVRAALRNGLTRRRDQGDPAADRRLLRRARRQRRLRDRAGSAGRGGTRRDARGAALRRAHAHRALRRRALAGASRRPRRRSRSRRRSSAPASTPAEIEDVYFGCANQAGEDNRNVARMAALLAGLPQSVAGVTLNRLCASGLAAISAACHAVLAGDGDLFVAGGVESMSRAPLVTGQARARVPARRPHALRQHARLALPQSGDGGDVPAREHGRDGRERGRALRRQPRGPGRVRAALAAALGRGAGSRALRGRADPRRRRDGRRASAPRLDGRGAGQAAPGVPRRRHASRPATRAASTTAPRRS